MAEKYVVSRLNGWTRAVLTLALASPVGCAHQGDTAYQIREGGRGGEPDRPQAVLAEGQERAELPPHRFAPPAHTANRYQRPRGLSLAALPKLVESKRCFNAGAVEEGQRKQIRGRTRRAKAASKAPKKRSRSFVEFHANAAPAAPTSVSSEPAFNEAESKKTETENTKAVAPPPPTGPVATQAPAKSAAVGGNDGGDSFDEEQVMAESAPADDAGAPMTMSPPADRNRQIASNERDHNKARRKAKREQRKLDRASGRKDRTRGKSRPLGGTSAPGTAASDTSADEPDSPRLLPPVIPPIAEGWGQPLFLSNDDSMSLSSAQRINFAIDEFQPIDPNDIRKHELLNWAFGELDATVAPDHVFAVDADFAPTEVDNEYALAVAVHGRRLRRGDRRNAALTLVVDESGSMKAEGRMEYLQRGLLRMARELKSGDVVNLVTFDHRVCPRLSNFVVGRDDMSILTRAIHKLRPRGATNLHAGLTEGYTRADQSYQPTYSNRVMLITDALANKGVTDARTLSMVTDWHDSRRIRLSGVGVGKEFNDHLLDQLTEKGRGAYVFLGSEQVVDDVFGTRFVSLVETVANDVHFRLHLPSTLRVERFHGEESSTDKAEVQAVHFFANNSQVLLSDVQAWEGKLRPEDELMLEIEFQDPQSGQVQREFHVVPVDRALQNRGALATNAQLIVRFSEAITQMAMLGAPAGAQARAGGWRDPQGAQQCAAFREEFVAFGNAAWKNSALSVWDRYCARYDQRFGRRPTRKR